MSETSSSTPSWVPTAIVSGGLSLLSLFVIGEALLRACARLRFSWFRRPPALTDTAAALLAAPSAPPKPPTPQQAPTPRPTGEAAAEVWASVLDGTFESESPGGTSGPLWDLVSAPRSPDALFAALPERAEPAWTATTLADFIRLRLLLQVASGGLSEVRINGVAPDLLVRGELQLRLAVAGISCRPEPDPHDETIAAIVARIAQSTPAASRGEGEDGEDASR